MIFEPLPQPFLLSQSRNLPSLCLLFCYPPTHGRRHLSFAPDEGDAEHAVAPALQGGRVTLGRPHLDLEITPELYYRVTIVVGDKVWLSFSSCGACHATNARFAAALAESGT